jgi:hypothetical protein
MRSCDYEQAERMSVVVLYGHETDLAGLVLDTGRHEMARPLFEVPWPGQ